MIFLSAGFLAGLALLVLGVIAGSWEGIGVGGAIALVWGLWLWFRYGRSLWASHRTSGRHPG